MGSSARGRLAFWAMRCGKGFRVVVEKFRAHELLENQEMQTWAKAG